MSLRGVAQLRALRLVYCDHTGSSRGVQHFVANGGFEALQARLALSPATEVRAEIRRGGDPHVIATYACGTTKSVGLKNASAETTATQCDWLRTEKGKPGSKPIKARHFTKHPSVQGQWTPFTFGEGAPYDADA